MTAKQALREIRAPDEPAAEDRAWAVVRGAYLERVPAVRRTRHRRIALVPALMVVVAAVALSPAGATMSTWIRHTLGIPHAASSLFSLPTPGRLLVSGPSGTWTVGAGGSTRRIGPWRGATWSPHGRYIAVAGRGQLAAVDPHGTQQWALARPGVSDPTWYPPSGFRVAYLAGHQLRVVAGDGTGDRLFAAGVALVSPKWRPDHPYQIAYVNHAGRLLVRDADSGRTVWTAAPGRPKEVAWSADGSRLLVVTDRRALVYAPSGDPTTGIVTLSSTSILDASLSPDGRTLALLRGGAAQDVAVASLARRGPRLRRVLSGNGLQQLAWSPDSRWLLVSWPLADQWVFVRVAGRPRIAAVSHITRQFAAKSRAPGLPRIDGWCCTAGGT
jgi:hypothetical protein